MTKPVTLSEAAFKALRKVKRAGESDSDVVLRLVERGVAKDPRVFLKVKLHPAFSSWDDYEVFREKMRQADARKSRRLHRGA